MAVVSPAETVAEPLTEAAHWMAVVSPAETVAEPLTELSKAAAPPPPAALTCSKPVGVTREAALLSSPCTQPVGDTRLYVATDQVLICGST